jgi:DNA-binding transcriptional regulator YiaG
MTTTSTQAAPLLSGEFLTDSDLARELNVSTRTIARWNALHRTPQRPVQLAVALW